MKEKFTVSIVHPQRHLVKKNSLGSFCWLFMTSRCLSRGVSLIHCAMQRKNYIGHPDCLGCLDQEAFHNADASASWDSKLSEKPWLFDCSELPPSWELQHGWTQSLFKWASHLQKSFTGIKTWMLYLHCCKGVGLFFALQNSRCCLYL